MEWLRGQAVYVKNFGSIFAVNCQPKALKVVVQISLIAKLTCIVLAEIVGGVRVYDAN
jgi:hypothetical protein